jgi:hypothetical protein
MSRCRYRASAWARLVVLENGSSEQECVVSVDAVGQGYFDTV